MTQQIPPTQLPPESSTVTQVANQAPALSKVGSAQQSSPTGITNVEGPNEIVQVGGAVAQEVLPMGDAEAQRFADALPQSLVQEGQAFAEQIVRDPNSPELQSRWAEYVAQVQSGSEGYGLDVNGLVQWVLREAYLQNTEDLHFYAQKVKFFNEMKKAIRDELQDARKLQAEISTAAALWAKQQGDDADPKDYPLNVQVTADDGTVYGPFGHPNAKTFDPSAIEFDENGNPVFKVSEEPLNPNTREGLETYIKNLEEQLSSVGDDAQLANVDLQNNLQKQQQTLQMMSNISKMLHDTAMAIIRKIG